MSLAPKLMGIYKGIAFDKRYLKKIPAVSMCKLELMKLLLSTHNKPSTMIEATYEVCEAGERSRCPVGDVFLDCRDRRSIADWAATECATYTEALLKEGSGGMCGFRISQNHFGAKRPFDKKHSLRELPFFPQASDQGVGERSPYAVGSVFRNPQALLQKHRHCVIISIRKKERSCLQVARTGGDLV